MEAAVLGRGWSFVVIRDLKVSFNVPMVVKEKRIEELGGKKRQETMALLLTMRWGKEEEPKKLRHQSLFGYQFFTLYTMHNGSLT